MVCNPILDKERRLRCRTCRRCGKCFSEFPPSDEVFGCADAVPALVKRRGIGAAVDLGTTTIDVGVYNLETGEVIHRSSFVNPQRRISSDVMGRISAAADGRLDELRDLVRDALRDRFRGYGVSEAVVVGNTTMLHLFAGISPCDYAAAPFVAKNLFGESMEIDGVKVRLPRCVHGFFGADAVASVRMSGMCGRGGGCELTADIGTNGEIALWKPAERELTVASVAAGPAFERPGITGSRIVSSLADALESGAVDRTGLVLGELPDGLVQDDVRMVQLAKAALKGGIATLLSKAGIGPGDITRFSIAGGFGTALDLKKAERIGLFPEGLSGVARVCGNLAAEGAAAALFDPSFSREIDGTAAAARYVELAGDAGFYDAFMKSISF